MLSAVTASQGACRHARRRCDKNSLRRIVNTQALRLVPRLKDSRDRQTFANVSCAKSSASSLLPANDRAKARRKGISLISSSSNSAKASMSPCAFIVGYSLSTRAISSSLPSLCAWIKNKPDDASVKNVSLPRKTRSRYAQSVEQTFELDDA